MIETGYPNTGLISRNYDAINKENHMILGNTVDELKVNTSGTMQVLSEEEVREMHEKSCNEQRTLNVESSEIVNNVYWKTGDNITYNVNGVSFSNEEMKACKAVVKNAIAELATKGSDLDYKDYATMGIAANMVNTYATEHLTKEQAEVVNKSIKDYLDSLVQTEKERHVQSGYLIDATEGVGNKEDLNKYYAVRHQLSDEAVDSLKSQLTSNLPEMTRNTLFANLEHAKKNGSVVQSASNEQLAHTIKAMFQSLNLRDGNAVNDAYEKYKAIMTPVYKANGIENTNNHDSLSHVLELDVSRFSIQIANTKAVLNSIGSSVDICI